MCRFVVCAAATRVVTVVTAGRGPMLCEPTMTEYQCFMRANQNGVPLLPESNDL